MDQIRSFREERVPLGGARGGNTMTQSPVSTTQEGMASARAEFEQKSGLFIQQLSSVNSEMGTLQASWQGTASLNFNAAMDNWEQGFQRVINALNGMIGSMGGNATMYAGQEDAASQIANNFGNVVGGGAGQFTPAGAPNAGLPGMS